MTWLGALAIAVPVWTLIAVGIAAFAHADKRYQAEKLADLRARGLYRPVTGYRPDWKTAYPELLVKTAAGPDQP